MRVRKTAPELARSLGRHGMRFRSFSLSSEGRWSPEDADWNYKDVPHLNQVHTLASTVPAAIGDEVIVTVNIQKIVGIPMPIALANYVATDGSQVYYTTLLSFVLVVETRINDGEDGTTLVQTTYHIGGPPILMWAFPLLRRILTANYRVLMSEDLPMREQRGRLRSAGYRFASDGRPRTFAETVDLTVDNVIAPPPVAGKSITVDLGSLAQGSTVCAGEGPGGLRVVRGPSTEVMIFQRVCSHEGASLDEAKLISGCLVCPWHAKRVRPLATVDLEAPIPRRLEIGSGVELVIEDLHCTVVGLS